MLTDERPGAGGRRFATTRWSLVLAAGEHGAGGSQQALAELCSRYWVPLYSYVRRRGYQAEDACDLTQAFFAELLERKSLRSADRARGRFRSFLLTAMKNFLAGQWRKQRALKRGGGVDVLSLDFDAAEDTYRLEPRHGLSPEAIYHRRWALGLLEQALVDLRRRYEQDGKAELFEALEDAVAGDPGSLPYAELSRRLGQSEGSLRTAASRLRGRWRRRLRELVAETVGEEAEISDELRSLIASVEVVG